MLPRLIAFFAGIAVAVALLLSVTIMAQDGPLAFLAPHVIDIQQDVPILAEVNGATVPITVGVALQISLSGPMTFSVEAAPPPVVAVATTRTQTVSNAAEDNLGVIVLDGVYFHLLEAIDTGDTFKYMEEERDPDFVDTTQGKFGVLYFHVENNGQEPAVLYRYIDGYDYKLRLVDEKGRRFTSYDLRWRFDDLCEGKNVNPGIGAECYVVFELPNDVSGLSIQFDGDPNKQTIAIPALVLR